VGQGPRPLRKGRQLASDGWGDETDSASGGMSTSCCYRQALPLLKCGWGVALSEEPQAARSWILPFSGAPLTCGAQLVACSVLTHHWLWSLVAIA
jgi:hypothetical protein